MKRGKYFLAFWEIVLILGSIPVFRSVWMVLDGFDFMNRGAGIALSFGVGLLLCVIALLILNMRANKQEGDGRDDKTND